MPSLNESMATRLYQWARDLKLIETEQYAWKSLSHQDKEKWRSLARNLHNYLGSSSYPEGNFQVVPDGHYKIRPYVRPYGQVHDNEADRSTDRDGAENPDEVQATSPVETLDHPGNASPAGVRGGAH